MNTIRDPFCRIRFGIVQVSVTPVPVVRYFLSFMDRFDKYYNMCWRDEEWA